MSFQLYLKVSTLCLLAFLVACDTSVKQKTNAKPAIAPNNANIDKFTLHWH